MDSQELFQMRLGKAQSILATAGLSSPYARVERVLQAMGARVPPVLFMSSAKRFWFLFITTAAYMVPIMLIGAMWPAMNFLVALLMGLTASFLVAAMTSMYFDVVRGAHNIPLWETLV